MSPSSVKPRMAPDEPTRKKVRQAPEAPSKSGRSRGEGSTAGLFQPFRALGQITTQAPFSLVARGNALFVTTCLEYNFQVYDVKTLNLLFVSPRTECPLEAIAAIGSFTYVGIKGSILTYERAREVKRFPLSGGASVQSLTPFGSLLLCHTDDNALTLLDCATGDTISRLAWTRSDTEVTAYLHPDTYVNKILVGSSQGHMELWSTQTNTLIHRFPQFGGPITCLVQTPVLDVVGVGLLDGTILLYNLKLEETLLKFQQEGRVTAISFRTDEKAQHMVTANAHGDLTFWDLEEGRLAHTLVGAHEGPVSSAHFLPGLPILMSSGSDNALRQWTFDGPEGQGRILRQRSGHYAPPTRVRFHGSQGSQWILSSGRDRSLRLLSTLRDSQSTELSQGSVERNARKQSVRQDQLKLPAATHFTASSRQEKYWDNVVTAHLGESGARTWSTKRRAIGKHRLMSRDDHTITTTEISGCGHFGLLGTSSGRIDLFNLQSGVYRRSFLPPRSPSSSSSREEEWAKVASVTGIAVDAANHQLISGSLDGQVRIWDFTRGTLTTTLDMTTPVTGLALHRENDLAAVMCDDLSVRVIDVQTHRVSRIFRGHTHRLTDMAFSPDGRWIVTASLDSTIRVWDLPTGHMVDWMRLPDICTTLSFSPDGSFLATGHADQVAIYLWANRSQFHHVPLGRLDVDAPTSGGSSALPGVLAFTGEEAEGEGKKEEEEEEEGLERGMEKLTVTAKQLAPSMVTLSREPASKWQTLLNLEAIRERNKPIEAPKAPEKAPFFLSTTQGVAPQFIKNPVKEEEEREDGKEEDEKEKENSRFLHFQRLDPLTSVGVALREGEVSGDYSKVMQELRGLGPSAVDVEIRTLSPGDGARDLRAFVAALDWQLRSRREFELVEAYLTVFLRVHGDVIAGDSKLAEAVEALGRRHQEEWGRLEGQVHKVLCLVDFCRQ